jgi:hypothetical protein
MNKEDNRDYRRMWTCLKENAVGGMGCEDLRNLMSCYEEDEDKYLLYEQEKERLRTETKAWLNKWIVEFSSLEDSTGKRVTWVKHPQIEVRYYLSLEEIRRIIVEEVTKHIRGC